MQTSMLENADLMLMLFMSFMIFHGLIPFKQQWRFAISRKRPNVLYRQSISALSPLHLDTMLGLKRHIDAGIGVSPVKRACRTNDLQSWLIPSNAHIAQPYQQNQTMSEVKRKQRSFADPDCPEPDHKRRFTGIQDVTPSGLHYTQLSEPSATGEQPVPIVTFPSDPIVPLSSSPSSSCNEIVLSPRSFRDLVTEYHQNMLSKSTSGGTAASGHAFNELVRWCLANGKNVVLPPVSSSIFADALLKLKRAEHALPDSSGPDLHPVWSDYPTRSNCTIEELTDEEELADPTAAFNGSEMADDPMLID